MTSLRSLASRSNLGNFSMKIQTLETQLQDMVTKTKEALDILQKTNPNFLVAQHMRSANTKSAEWHELDRKSKIEPVMPPKLMIEIQQVLQNESKNGPLFLHHLSTMKVLLDGRVH